jgi:hypothetical protein
MSSLRSLGRLLSVTALALSGFVALSSGGTAGAVVARTCSASQVSISASTPKAVYTAGTPISVNFSLHNHSGRSCSFTTGPFSPSFVLTNASGITVWASCWYGGGPAPCAMYLVHRTLAGGATFRSHTVWDQKTGHPDVQVAAGTYRLSVMYDGIKKTARTSFSISGVSSVTAVSLADNRHHYTLVTGSELRVSLVPSGVYTWSTPVSSNSSVLAALSADPVAGSTLFSALTAGTVQVSASGNPACSPACMLPSRIFSITVSVIA